MKSRDPSTSPCDSQSDKCNQSWAEHQSRQLVVVERLLNAKATSVFRSPHFWVITALSAALAGLYYRVPSTTRDIYVILFLYPLIYAATVYRFRGVLVGWGVFLSILLITAWLSPSDPHLLVRSLLFATFAFLISGLTATQLNYLEEQIMSCREVRSLNDQLTEHLQTLERTQQQLIHSEKLNALGELSASIAHEINNPLAGALVYTRLLSKKVERESLDRDDAVATLSKIDVAISHCSTLIKGLLEFARQTEPALKPTLMTEIVDRVLGLVGHQAEMKRIEVIRKATPTLPRVMVDPDQMTQVLLNLVVNAIQAMPEQGRLAITTSGSEKEVRVSVQDNGSGIAPENMSRLFTPFFTTKEAGKGVGLGLAVSFGLVERHNGQIEVQSKLGEGSTFTVILPATSQA